MTSTECPQAHYSIITLENDSFSILATEFHDITRLIQIVSLKIRHYIKK